MLQVCAWRVHRWRQRAATPSSGHNRAGGQELETNCCIGPIFCQGFLDLSGQVNKYHIAVNHHTHALRLVLPRPPGQGPRAAEREKQHRAVEVGWRASLPASAHLLRLLHHRALSSLQGVVLSIVLLHLQHSVTGQHLYQKEVGAPLRARLPSNSNPLASLSAPTPNHRCPPPLLRLTVQPMAIGSQCRRSPCP